MASFGRELSRRQRGTCKSRSPSTFSIGGNQPFYAPKDERTAFATIAFPARVIPKWPSALQGSNAERRGIIENPGHSIAQPATTHFFAIKFRFCEKATKIFLDKIFHKIVKKSKQKGDIWFQDIIVKRCLKAGLSEEKLSLMPRLRTLSNVLF